MKYEIIEASNTDELREKINIKLSDGYIIIGKPVRYKYKLLQIMIKSPKRNLLEDLEFNQRHIE